MADEAFPSPEEVRSLARRLRSRSEVLKARSVAGILDSLGAAGERFLDPLDSIRIEALDQLPESAALSAPMATAVLDGMAVDWTGDRLRRLVEVEFGGGEVLDSFHVERGRSTRAFGAHLTVQVVAGSVPGVGVNALVRALLVKSPTLIKAGAGDTLLPTLFARALAEVDADLASSLAVEYWPGSSDSGRTEQALAHADLAVLYGSDHTVATLSRLAPAATRVVTYRHREALILVGRDALGDGAETAAAAVARAVSMFDQRGCVCPHLVLVEEGGEIEPARFARVVALALSEVERRLPSATLAPNEAVAIQQLRGVLELQAAASGGFVTSGAPSASWTVAFEPEAIEGPTTFARGVRVRPIADFENLGSRLGSRADHLQSVGVVGLGEHAPGVAYALGLLGASRVVPIEDLPFPPPWWLHDGRGPLRELVRWVEVETGEGR